MSEGEAFRAGIGVEICCKRFLFRWLAAVTPRTLTAKAYRHKPLSVIVLDTAFVALVLPFDSFRGL